MNKQKVLETLQDLEEMTFYQWAHNPTDENKQVNEKAKEALVTYYEEVYKK